MNQLQNRSRPNQFKKDMLAVYMNRAVGFEGHLLPEISFLHRVSGIWQFLSGPWSGQAI